jgi:hypothetical protein
VATSKKKQKSKLRTQRLPPKTSSTCQRSPSPNRAGTPFGYWLDWTVDQQLEWVAKHVIGWEDRTDKEKAEWYRQKDKEERLLEREREAQSLQTPTPIMSQAPLQAPTPSPSATAPPSIPASATVTTNDMKRVIYDLGVVVGQIATQLQDLMAEVHQSQVTKPRTHNTPPVP